MSLLVPLRITRGRGGPRRGDDAFGRRRPPGPRGRDATGRSRGDRRARGHRPGGSVRTSGSDLVEGTTLVEPGTAITPAAVALLAGAGVARVDVHRRPRVAVLATGDEVRAPGPGPRRRPASPTRTAPGCGPSSTPPAPTPLDLGIAPRRSRTCCAPSPARSRGGCRSDHRRRAASRSGHSTSSRRLRGRRLDRPVAGRRPTGQAVRVRDRARPGGGPPRPALRPARQPGVELRDVRAVRPTRDPARGRPRRSCDRWTAP